MDMMMRIPQMILRVKNTQTIVNLWTAQKYPKKPKLLKQKQCPRRNQ